MLGSEVRAGRSFLPEPPDETVLGAFRTLATVAMTTVDHDYELKQQLMHALNSECFVDDASHGFQDHGNCIDAIRHLSEKLLPDTFLVEADYVLEAIVDAIYGSHAVNRVQSDLNILCSDHPDLNRLGANEKNPYKLPLWTDERLVPKTLDLDFSSFHAKSSAAGGKWQYWIEWYQSFAMGKPLDWELQRRVVMIEEKYWIAGPGAIADEIERIRARWQVETAQADLGSSLRIQAAERHGIGGNNPPESIQDEHLSGAVTLIWEAKEELSTALKQENPAREWIEAILAKFKAGLTSLLKWCAGKVNLAVGTAIVVGTTKGSTVVVDTYIAKHPEKIEALIEAIERWLPFLS